MMPQPGEGAKKVIGCLNRDGVHQFRGLEVRERRAISVRGDKSLSQIVKAQEIHVEQAAAPGAKRAANEERAVKTGNDNGNGPKRISAAGLLDPLV